MIPAVRIASSRIARTAVVPRAVTALGATRSMAISETYGAKVSEASRRNWLSRRSHINATNYPMNEAGIPLMMPMQLNVLTSYAHVQFSQEKVEEDRYIRAREAELAAAKAKAEAADAKAKELEAKSAELLAKKTAAMTEAADLLAQTGDVVSEAGLANLTDWKFGSS